jgi:hypothetical protein
MTTNIYEPLKFSTRGIADLATQDTLVVSNGKITVDTVEAKLAVAFSGANFSEVEGKGIQWTDGRKNKSLVFKKSALWTNMSLNLDTDQSYSINDVPVLSFSDLGPTVTKSNLKQVGTLKTLNVSGNASFGEFAYLVSDLNRIGVNTDVPKAAIGIRENGIEVVLGSLKTGTASVGTVDNHNFEIITDNTARITVSNNGDVRIHGKIYADEVVTQRSSPVIFKETETSSIYGKGILWTGLSGTAKQLVYQANPDRIWSTETIDLAENKYFAINRVPVLSQSTLGDTVTQSNIQKLGVLRELQVMGDAAITRTILTSRIEIGKFAVAENRLETRDTFAITRNGLDDFSINANIVLGNVENKERTISLYGQTTVGVAQPAAGVSLTVAGAVSFDNKKFETGNSAPNTGHYTKGDIVWNQDPKATDYIGWVCVVEGAPGAWLPFGAIASR